MSLLAELYRGGWLRSVDHALAESLRRLRPDSPDLLLAAIALTSRAVASGHSHLPIAKIDELLQEISGEREPPPLPACEDWLALLRVSPWIATSATTDAVSHPFNLEDDALALRRYWQYECRLAALICSRIGSPFSAIAPEVSDRLAQLFASEENPTESQQAAIARATLQQKFLLLTGGPGTGKTTAVTRVLVLFAEQHVLQNKLPRILLAAPTGKAAARLAESVRQNLADLAAAGLVSADIAHSLPTEAKTLHRLLGWQRDSSQFRHHAACPLPADLVVVDEASMIDLPMMCKLFEAVASDTTLILIGDRDQLPSVETGDVLASLCDAAVHTPRLAAQRIHLVHSHRHADDVEVTALAALIRDGQTDTVIDGLSNERFRGVRWQSGNDRALAETVLNHALPAYRAVQAATTIEDALTLAKQFRVLTAVREGPAGSQQLNTQIAAALGAMEKNGAQRREAFFHGRLVLITENSYRHGLFNGDIGIAWGDEHDHVRVWFDTGTGLRAWLPTALPAHESAFVLTVHKSQGSEFERVLLALPEHPTRTVSRELLYTGLTRCRRDVTLWASDAILREGIARKAQRWSGLAARLH